MIESVAWASEISWFDSRKRRWPSWDFQSWGQKKSIRDGKSFLERNPTKISRRALRSLCSSCQRLPVEEFSPHRYPLNHVDISPVSQSSQKWGSTRQQGGSTAEMDQTCPIPMRSDWALDSIVFGCGMTKKKRRIWDLKKMNQRSLVFKWFSLIDSGDIWRKRWSSRPMEVIFAACRGDRLEATQLDWLKKHPQWFKADAGYTLRNCD